MIERQLFYLSVNTNEKNQDTIFKIRVSKLKIRECPENSEFGCNIYVVKLL